MVHPRAPQRRLGDSREYTFNHYGDRGSVDIVGWHRSAGALLIVEVKTRLVDVQDLLRSMDIKRRIVPSLLERELRWKARRLGRIALIEESGANRRAVERHRDTFAAAFPQRSVEARRWIRAPDGDLAAIRFSPAMLRGHGRQGRGGPTRIRAPR